MINACGKPDLTKHKLQNRPNNFKVLYLYILHGFVKVALINSCHLQNKTKLKFDQDVKAFSSFCFELKVPLVDWLVYFYDKYLCLL